MSLEAFDELLASLNGDGAQVAIFDAANVTIQRRAKLQEKAAKHKLGIVFVETIVTDEGELHRQMRWKVQNSPDFAGMDEAAAMADLLERISHYQKVYQTVRETEGPYIKLFDLRAKAQCCNIYGRMANRLMPFLLATHAIPRSVFLLLLPNGNEADASIAHRQGLCAWFAAYARKADLQILTSTEPRAIAAAEAVADVTGGERPCLRPMLTPLLKTSKEDAGAATFRSRFGESVDELVVRLEPIILEVEGAVAPLLVVASEAPCRALRTYLRSVPIANLGQREAIDPTLKIDSSQPRLLQFQSGEAGGFMESLIELA